MQIAIAICMNIKFCFLEKMKKKKKKKKKKIAAICQLLY